MENADAWLNAIVSITASELQDVYDEVADLKESVTEKNVYSEKEVSNRVFLNINIFYYVSKINCQKILALAYWQC